MRALSFLCALHALPSFGAMLGPGIGGLFGFFEKSERETFMSRVQQRFNIFTNSPAMGSSALLQQALDRLDALYAEIVLTKQRQEDALSELTRRGREARPRGVDESLESFRKAYNESMSFLGSGGDGSSVPRVLFQKRRLAGQSPSAAEGESFSRQMEVLTGKVRSTWEAARHPRASLQSTLDDLKSVQHNLLDSAKVMLNATMSASAGSTTRTWQDLVRERKSLDKNLRKLEREGYWWIEQRVTQIESTIRLVQEKIATTNSAYEELLTKRRASLYYTALSDSCLSQVLKLMEMQKKNIGWKKIREDDGYEVYRKMMGVGPGSQYACVLCHGIIKSPPKDVFALFEDDSRIREYNALVEKGRDIEVVAENTKVTWMGTPPVFPFKPRDFCTLIHTRKLKDGTYIVINKATTHPDAPPTAGYVRGAIVLGANIIEPVPGDGRKSKVTMIAQLDPGGFAPPVAVNHVRPALLSSGSIAALLTLLSLSSPHLTPPSLFTANRFVLWDPWGSCATLKSRARGAGRKRRSGRPRNRGALFLYLIKSKLPRCRECGINHPAGKNGTGCCPSPEL